MHADVVLFLIVNPKIRKKNSTLTFSDVFTLENAHMQDSCNSQKVNWNKKTKMISKHTINLRTQCQVTPW